MDTIDSIEQVATRLHQMRGGNMAVIGPVRLWTVEDKDMLGVVVGTNGCLDMVYLGEAMPELNESLKSAADTVICVSSGNQISGDRAEKLRTELMWAMHHKRMTVVLAETEVQTAEIWHKISNTEKSAKVLEEVKRDNGDAAE